MPSVPRKVLHLMIGDPSARIISVCNNLGEGHRLVTFIDKYTETASDLADKFGGVAIMRAMRICGLCVEKTAVIAKHLLQAGHHA